MSVKIYNSVVLVACIIILTISMTWQAGELGISIFGFKWQLHCMSRHLVGIDCALCGMTHSFCAIGHGQFAKGFEYHRLGPMLFCFILFQIPYRIFAIAVRKRKRSLLRKTNVYFAVVVGIALIVNWLVYLGGRIL